MVWTREAIKSESIDKACNGLEPLRKKDKRKATEFALSVSKATESKLDEGR